MKYPFKLTKTNKLYATVVAIIGVLLMLLLFGFNGIDVIYNCLGICAMVFFIPCIFAVIFWFLLGRKEKGGTTIFNIMLSLILLGIIQEIRREENHEEVNGALRKDVTIEQTK